jgi:hypothetical protein
MERKINLVAAAAILCVGAVPGFAAPDWDIVGVRLGMTEPQARAAIKAHSAQAEISEQALKFTFSDGAKQQETPSFLATIEVRIPGPPNTSDSERLKIEFSAPPLPQRVIGVRREITTYSNPPALDRMLDSLNQKYGKPLHYATYGIGMKNGISHWAEAGKPRCGEQPGRGPMFTPASQGPRELNKYRQWQKQGFAPADLSKCSALLQANVTIHQGGSSVVGLVTEMNDIGYMLPALLSTEKWLADKEAEARRARLESGTTPKL